MPTPDLYQSNNSNAKEIYKVGTRYLFAIGDTYHVGKITRLMADEIEIRDVSFLIPTGEVQALLSKGVVPAAASSLPLMIINRQIYRTAIPL